MTEQVRWQQKITVALLLLCAAGTTLFADTRGLTSWEMIDWMALFYLGLAMVFGVWALVLSSRETPAEDGRVRSPRWVWIALAVMLAIHAGLAARKLRLVNPEQIDTYLWQHDAVKLLLSGHDPYGGTIANIYSPRDTARFYGSSGVVNGRVQNGMPYPPVSLVSAVLGYELGDVRWTFVFCVLITGVCFVWLSGGVRGLALAAMLLLNPFTFYVESNCWTEPLVVMLLALSMVAAAKRAWWLPVAVGLFLVSKQFGLLAAPFGIFLVRDGDWRAALRLILKSLGVAALTLLPFAVWNWRGLWHDLVIFHLQQPFRQDALSFAVPLRWMQAVGPVMLLMLLVWVVLKGMRSSGMFAAAFGVSLMLFVGTSRQAAPNYYFLIVNALLCGVSALPGSPLFEGQVEATHSGTAI